MATTAWARSLFITTTGLPAAEKAETQRLAAQLGANFSDNFTTATTHLVAQSVGSAKYDVACKHGIAVVTTKWLPACELANQLLDVTPFALHIFAGITVAITGERYKTIAARQAMQAALEAHGASVRGNVDRTITHLLSDGTDSPKLRAVRASRDLANVKVVTEAWVHACMHSNRWLPEAGFEPPAPAAAPRAREETGASSAVVPAGLSAGTAGRRGDGDVGEGGGGAQQQRQAAARPRAKEAVAAGARHGEAPAVPSRHGERGERAQPADAPPARAAAADARAAGVSARPQPAQHRAGAALSRTASGRSSERRAAGGSGPGAEAVLVDAAAVGVEPPCSEAELAALAAATTGGDSLGFGLEQGLGAPCATVMSSTHAMASAFPGAALNAGASPYFLDCCRALLLAVTAAERAEAVRILRAGGATRYPTLEQDVRRALPHALPRTLPPAAGAPSARCAGCSRPKPCGSRRCATVAVVVCS